MPGINNSVNCVQISKSLQKYFIKLAFYDQTCLLFQSKRMLQSDNFCVQPGICTQFMVHLPAWLLVCKQLTHQYFLNSLLKKISITLKEKIHILKKKINRLCDTYSVSGSLVYTHTLNPKTNKSKSNWERRKESVTMYHPLAQSDALSLLGLIFRVSQSLGTSSLQWSALPQKYFHPRLTVTHH